MKKIFYLSLFLLTAFFISHNVDAQTPGGVAGSVLWLKANTDASPNIWFDKSPSGNDFLQPSAGNQPSLISNVFNFNAAMLFDGSNTFMEQGLPADFPENDNDRTIIVVANATSFNGYRWIFAYGTPGGSSTCQAGNFNGDLLNAFYGVDITTSAYWNAASNANGALASFTLSSSVGTQFDRGAQTNQVSFGPLFATSVNGVIGALLPSTNGEVWGGSIAEVLMFNTALSPADRNKVESYLALKYGFTLGTAGTPLSYTASDGVTVYWTGSATYQNDVFGIGTDNGTGLAQTQSNSTNSGNGNGTGQAGKGNLVLSTAAALPDNQFLLIGNDAAALTEQTIAAGQAPVIAEGSQRVVRNWKAQNTGAVGSVSLSFDMTGLTYTGGTTANNYRLMIDSDGDADYFTTGTQTFIAPSSVTGNLVNFTGVTLATGAGFTIITQASVALLPAVWQGFSASVQKNKATLSWKTSNEVNVDRYVAEYSLNGVNFLPVGSVTAKNGAGINVYSLTQDNLPAGIRYYRIKRADKDGQFQFSDVKSVRAGGLTTVILKSNPVTKGRLELNIDVPQSQEAIIRVVNMAGKILVQQNTGLTTGTNAVNTNIAHIAAGTYFLQVQLGTEIINKKFVRL
ncbi:MAG: T9SS type A sorting domain-containing protein [Chitinophagaceae bacterium]